MINVGIKIAGKIQNVIPKIDIILFLNDSIGKKYRVIDIREIKNNDGLSSFLLPFQYSLWKDNLLSWVIYLKFPTAHICENLPQNVAIGNAKGINDSNFVRAAIWRIIISNKACIPIAPDLLSFIASRHFLGPAAIPSNVSISPSRWRPPVRIIPIAIEIRIDGDGEEKLDFTYIKDLVQGVKKIISTNKSRNQIFNLTFGLENLETLLEVI